MPVRARNLRMVAPSWRRRGGVPLASGEAELLVTELATNVLKHVGEGALATLVLEWKGERLRLEVHDKSTVVPTPRAADCGDESGRGLRLLAAMAVDWGTVLTAAGKAVWCEISLSGGRGCRRVERAVEALENYKRVERGPGRQGRGREVRLVESAVELIADLLHWTTARGHDPDDILDQAQMH
jgi:hypothetical protein